MDGKRKIILIGSIPPPHHGSNVYFNSLINSKIGDFFEMTFLDISDHRGLNNLSKLDFTNSYLATKNLISLLFILKEKSPDLIYIPISSNFLPYLRDGLFILISSFFSNAKIVIHLHEGDYFRRKFYNESNHLVKFFIRRSLSKVHTAIVYSDSMKYVFSNLVKNIVAFPNGIDLKSIPGLNGSTKLPEEKIVVSFYGNLYESKGVIDVLKAAAITVKKFRNVEFCFVGLWPSKERKTKEKAEQIINENKLENHVNFLGVLTGKKKEDFLIKTDIMVFPTWYEYEGCPLVILEAMAYGCPVVSTKNIGMISEIVIEGETGFLVDRQSPHQLAESISQLIKCPSQRKDMGIAGRKRFEEFFTLDRNVDNMINTFNNVK